MSARAIIAPMSFGDSSLPRININYLRPVPGAIYDWAVNQVPVGPLSQWPSLIDGAPLVSDGTPPVVSGSGKDRVARFDGLSSRMRASFSRNGPETIVAVYRFTAPKGLDSAFYGISAAGANFGAGSDSQMRAVSGSTQLYPSPAVKADTSWHIVILSVNGANSALRIDGTETTGNLAVSVRDGFTLGFGGAAPYRAGIEYKRVAYIPRATNSDERAAITDQMRAEYIS